MNVNLVLNSKAKAFLAASNIGSDVWWQNLTLWGCPIIMDHKSSTAKVTFFWQDPSGNES